MVYTFAIYWGTWATADTMLSKCRVTQNHVPTTSDLDGMARARLTNTAKTENSATVVRLLPEQV